MPCLKQPTAGCQGHKGTLLATTSQQNLLAARSTNQGGNAMRPRTLPAPLELSGTSNLGLGSELQ
eukprot:11500877-Alexandrium_andersonii.AAC.1